MSLFHLIDALSASFFALLGIWAAVVRRHWFLRFGVVGAVLLLALLIPAYELVIEFGIEVGLITAGVWLACGRRNWRPRLSLETALLTMVVVAVGAAFASRLPTLGAVAWAEIISVGVITAFAGLLCLWVVCSRARLWIRLACGLAGAVLTFVLLHYGAVMRSILQPGLRKTWQVAFAANYRREDLLFWLNHFGPTILLAFAILLSTLATARATGWFTSAAADGQRKSTRWTIPAKAILTCMLLAIAAPLFYLLFCLAAPPRPPAVDLPVPNGYDDFVAAGRAAPENVVTNMRKLGSMSRSQLKDAYDELAEVEALITQGLSRECRVRKPYYQIEPADTADVDAILHASIAILIRLEYLQEHGTTEEYVAACLRALRFSHECGRGGGLDSWDCVGESGASGRLQGHLGYLDAAACRQLASTLTEIEERREPLESKQAVQFIVDMNSDWKTRVQTLLTRWSGVNPNSPDVFQLGFLATTRLVIIDAALQAYWLRHGRAPHNLQELVPEYLPAIPLDPFGPQPMRYKRTRRGYTVYSVGWDRDDDGGKARDASHYYDIVAEGPHTKPWSVVLKSKLDDGRTQLWKLLLPGRGDEP